MKALVLALIPIGIFVLGFLAGKVRRPPDPKVEQQLHELQYMREELMTKAAEHATLGDDFAVIALDILAKKGTK
jgi:hypothetical protein